MSMMPPVDPRTGKPYNVSPFGQFEFDSVELGNKGYLKINGKIYKVETPSDEEVERHIRLQKLNRIIKII